MKLFKVRTFIMGIFQVRVTLREFRLDLVSFRHGQFFFFNRLWGGGGEVRVKLS